MKKVLVLLLVLGMASLASATLQISVNGDPQPVDSEIEIEVGSELVLDIWTDADIAPFLNTTFILSVDTNLGDISGGVPALGTENYMVIVQGETEDFTDVFTAPGEEGIWGSAATFNPVGGAIPAGTVLVDAINFICMGEGDAIVNLWLGGGAGAPTTLLDSVVIHQIPEPMTMALLGLGGLFLRRKK